MMLAEKTLCYAFIILTFFNFFIKSWNSTSLTTFLGSLKRLLSEFNVMENPNEHLVPKNVEQMGAECLARMQALFIQKPYCPVAVYGYKH